MREQIDAIKRNNLFSDALVTEEESIDTYEKLIDKANEHDKKIYEEILKDEKDHLIKLSEIQNK